MKGNIFKRILLLTLSVCMLTANFQPCIFAEDEEQQEQTQLSAKLEYATVTPENALSNGIISVSKSQPVTFTAYFPFITEGLKLTYDNSVIFDKTVSIEFAETGMSYQLTLEKGTTEATLSLNGSEAYGAHTITISTSNYNVDINRIDLLRNEAEYAYGNISDFVEIDYTAEEAALQTAAAFSDNSSLALIRNARRYLSNDDMTLKSIRQNGETYVTVSAVREVFRLIAEESSDGVIVRDNDIAELKFTSSGASLTRNGEAAETLEKPYITSGGAKLLPISFIAEVFGYKTVYSDGVTIVDEPYRIADAATSAMVSYIKSRIEVVEAKSGRELHVSQNDPNAADTNSGTAAAPFKTINAAAQTAEAGDKIIVHEGVYRETVTPKNDGTPGAPITIEAAAGEEVTVSALDVITKMVKYEEYAENAYIAKVPNAEKYKNQIFVNGKVYAEGRQPNTPNAEGRVLMSDYLELCPLWPTEGDISAKDNSERYVLTSEETLSEAKKDYWKYSIFHGLVHEGWRTSAGMVTKSEQNSITISDQTGVEGGTSFGYWGDSSNYRDTDYGYLTGHISAVDVPGEWTMQGNSLYIIMPEGTSPKTDTVEYKARQLLFDLSGRKNIVVRNIRGLGGSVTMKNAELCMLDGCSFEYASHFTWFADSREGYIDDRSDESETGAQTNGEVGLYIGGADNIVQNCTVDKSAGAGLYIAGKYSYIYNNNITECGYAGTMCCGIFIAFEPWRVSSDNYKLQPCFGGHAVYYNSVSKCGRSPLAINGGYTMLESRVPTRFAAMDIANNDFYEGGIMSGRDGGLYYAYGVGLGEDIIRTKIRDNLFWDYYVYDDFEVGIYLDAGHTDSEVYRNRCFYTNDKGAFVMTVANVGGGEDMPNTKSSDWDNGTVFYRPGGKAALTSADFPGGKAVKTGSTLAENGFMNIPSASEKTYRFAEGELSGITVRSGAARPTSTSSTIKISSVDFGASTDALRITYRGSAYTEADKLEIRLDSENGTKILADNITSTAKDFSGIITEIAEIVPVSGVHDIYVSFPACSSVEYIDITPTAKLQTINGSESRLIYCAYFDEEGNKSGHNQHISINGTGIKNTLNNTWVCYEGQYLKSAYNTVRIKYSTKGQWSGNVAKIILDDLNNTPIASFTLTGDDWNDKRNITAALADGAVTDGLHDVYILFEGGTITNSNVFELEFLTQ